jgi:anti-sigma B factor antagonist
MSLEFQQRDHEGITVVDLKGRLTMGQEVTSFRALVEKLNSKSAPSVILNMDQVDYVDSTGLGTLVMCSTSVRKVNGTVKLLNLNRRNIELLVATKLATIFEIFNDEQDAVNSFFPDRKINRFDILSFVKQMKEE